MLGALCHLFLNKYQCPKPAVYFLHPYPPGTDYFREWPTPGHLGTFTDG